MIASIDLFAGCGGATCGAAAAGAQVLWAANHWPLAVQVHSANHPSAIHVCQDLHLADVTKVPKHDFMWASPACTGHTAARGKEKPGHDTARATAWVVPQFAEYHQPWAIVVENVPALMDWKCYPAWRMSLENLGYKLTETIIDSADCGVPQHRERLFVVGSLCGSIEIPQPKAPHVPVNSVIDWDYEKWSPIRKPGRSQATLNRIARGRSEFGDRFVFPYYSSGSGLTGRSIHRPLGTVTTRDRWGIVDGDRMRMLNVEEYRKVMGFPDDYTLPANLSRRDSIFLLGNAVCPPVAQHITEAVMEVIA